MVFHIRRRSGSLSTDDASVSSTISVDRPNKQLTSSLKTKSVRFNLDLNQTRANKVICKEDCSELWYKASDYKYFKHATISAAKAIAQAEAKNKAPFSYQRVIEHTYSVCRQAVSELETYCLISTTEDRRHLNRWAEVAPSRIGMEKWAIRSVAKEKSMRRFEVVDITLDIQEAQCRNTADKEEFIRSSCERITRPSRLFAGAMAQALAASLRAEAEKVDFFA